MQKLIGNDGEEKDYTVTSETVKYKIFSTGGYTIRLSEDKHKDVLEKVEDLPKEDANKYKKEFVQRRMRKVNDVEVSGDDYEQYTGYLVQAVFG